MNFYKHHIGDYAQATAHLTFVEDAAYSRLLRKYYAEEKPIPADLKAAQRLVGARTRDEKDAVETVLGEFFVLESDGWHNKRADQEIEQAQGDEDEREARKANEAERQRRHRVRRRELFDQLREHGIVPKYDTKTEQLESMLSRVTGGTGHGDSNVTERVTGGTRHALATANQNPSTRSQKPEEEQGSPSTTGQAPDVGGAAAGHLAAALNRAGIRITSRDPRLIEAASGGITAAEVIELAALYPDKPAAYLLKAATSQRAESANGAIHGPRQPARRLSAFERVEQNIREARERDAAEHDDGNVIAGEAVRIAR